MDDKFDQQDIPAGGDGNSSTSQLNSTVAENDESSPKAINPIEPFLLLRHSFVAMVSFVSGIAFSAMFVIETILPDLFEDTYGFSEWQTGISCKRHFHSERYR